jgi:hypothetical protein
MRVTPQHNSRYDRIGSWIHLAECEPMFFPFKCYTPRVEEGKNTSTVIPASRKRRRKGNRISLRWDSASRPKRRLIRTYFWISLFTSYRITANSLIECNVILIANKELKNIYLPEAMFLKLRMSEHTSVAYNINASHQATACWTFSRQRIWATLQEL